MRASGGSVKETIVMAGGASGLGQVTAQRIDEEPDSACCSVPAAAQARAVKTLPLDLSRLDATQIDGCC
jgi:hypothetical protein